MSDGGSASPTTVLDEDSGSELARAYAQAILAAAENAGRVESVLDELDELIADVWQARPDFARLLVSAATATAEKDRILVETFDGRADPLVLNLLRVLNRHGRLGLLTSVANRARLLWEKKVGRQRVTVTSAKPLDATQQDALRESLSGMVGAEPILRYEVDPSLIGGLLVQVGDHVYDASIRNQLRLLRRQLLEEKATEVRRSRDAFTTY